VINLIIGFTIPAIDNSAHIGGLLAGAALAALVPFQKPGAETPGIFRTLQMVLLAAIVVSFYSVAKNYDGPHFSLRNLRGSFTQVFTTGSSSRDFVDAINTAQNTFEASAQELESRRTDHIGSLKADTVKAIDRLRKIPSIASNVDELTSALLRVMQDQYELIQDVERADTVTFAHGRRLKENVRAFQEIMMQFSKWVETDGRRFGIRHDR